MAKILKYGADSRRQVLSGVEKLAKTVRVTMGPFGKNVIIGKTIGAPVITKDGVSVAREVVLDDPVEELGCQLVKEAAGRTAAVAGDGTTTSTVLTYEIFKSGLDLVENGYNPVYFRNGVELAKKMLLEEIDSLTHKLDTDQDLLNIATISTNNDPILGQVIADAYIKTEKTGMVTAEARPGVQHSVRIIDGLEIDSGYISSSFLEKGSLRREMKNPVVLFCDFEITTVAGDTEILEMIKKAAECKREILIICKDLKKEGLRFFAENFVHGRMNVCAIRIPKYARNSSHWIEDLAAMTGSTIMGGDEGLELKDFTLSCLGSAESTIIDGYKTKIIKPNKNIAAVDSKLSLYNETIKHAIGDLDRKDLMDRISLLTSRSAIITVGYSTELELREKGDRVEDAIFAVKAAIENGFLIGGGFALYHAARRIRNNRMHEINPNLVSAVEVILKACDGPANQIISNADINPSILDESSEILKDVNYGYNTLTSQFENLLESGVIDPKKVTKTALENSISIALLLITSDAVIVDDPQRPSGWQPPAGYRMPSQNQELNHKH